jgi:antitoxin (DNA-binding transcriptional repressor) of toxin-antitoxin stability system
MAAAGEQGHEVTIAPHDKPIAGMLDFKHSGSRRSTGRA